jgi:hypothetical protein
MGMWCMIAFQLTSISREETHLWSELYESSSACQQYRKVTILSGVNKDVVCHRSSFEDKHIFKRIRAYVGANDINCDESVTKSGLGLG